jgi:DNA polymerase-3 subunit alpha
VHSSDWNFTPDASAPGGKGIRFGLGAVKNLGPSAVEAIIKGRAAVGRFRTIYQLCENVDLGAINHRALESLIKAGAMDSLEGTRAQLIAALDSAIEVGQRASRDRLSGQVGLFVDHAAGEHEQKPLPRVPDWTPREKLQGEKEMLGFFVTGHPLDEYKDKVCELATHHSGNLEGLDKGAEVALCGVLTGVQRKRNREGKAWASAQLEDLTGCVELLVFTTQYDRLAASLVDDQPVLVRGTALPEETNCKISVQDIIPLEVARVPLPSLISIRVWLGRNGSDKASALEELFRQKPGDTQVRLRLESPREYTVLLDVPAKVRPDRDFKAAIEKICGQDAIEVLAG